MPDLETQIRSARQLAVIAARALDHLSGYEVSIDTEQLAKDCGDGIQGELVTVTFLVKKLHAHALDLLAEYSQLEEADHD